MENNIFKKLVAFFASSGEHFFFNYEGTFFFC